MVKNWQTRSATEGNSTEVDDMHCNYNELETVTGLSPSLLLLAFLN